MFRRNIDLLHRYRSIAAILVALVGVYGPSAARAQDSAAVSLSESISGTVFDYTIREGDSFTLIGSRYGVGPTILARENGQHVGDRLVARKIIRVDNRHIVPIAIPYGIIINVPQRMLFYFQNDAMFGAYPIAVGRAVRRWQTPLGKFTVAQLREHPTWHVPLSIQKEMEDEGKTVEEEVEPGPDNPLGDYWIGLSIPSVGVHGTNVPVSVYSFRTHGCIRLHPDDARMLFNAARLGIKGEIVYIPLMMARLDDGRILVESDRDVYHRHSGGVETLRSLAAANHLSDSIDWNRVSDVVNAAEGIAREVGVSAARGIKLK